jgi:hypothetical protein
VTKLNQLIAVNKAAKNQAGAALTEAYHAIQRTATLAGISKTYQPRDEEGEKLAGEHMRVTNNVPAVIASFQKELARLFDVTCTIDTTNQMAKADVKFELNGSQVVLARDVPVATLLFLEKQLTDLATFVRKLPLLDVAEEWTPADQDGVWRSAPVVTNRSKKVPRNHVKAPATDKHPAQVEIYHEDKVVGDWTTIKFSGAIPHKQAKAMLDRINQLAVAVKQARESANMTEVVENHIGESILSYAFGA